MALDLIVGFNTIKIWRIIMATTGHESESINVEGLKTSLQALKNKYSLDDTVLTSAQSLTVAQKDQAISNILDKTDTSGMKRIVLKKTDNFKTVVEGQTGGNTIFVIQYEYTLTGNVTVPANCVLEFNGGNISAGSGSNMNTITGNNTIVKLIDGISIFNNIKTLGSFKAYEFPLNAFVTSNIDYLYSFLEAFSGTKFYLTSDYSVTGNLNEIDGAQPRNLYIDGKGYILTVHSFGVHNMEECEIKNITITASNNSVGDWHYDTFNFGLLGHFASSILRLYNVTFTSECDYAYLRGFKSADIEHCFGNGSYFYIYDIDCVDFCNNRVLNASYGYYNIGTQTENSFTHIRNNNIRNIPVGGFILSGGLKYNVTIENNIMENVGRGGAMDSCINIHPLGTTIIKNNRIVTNAAASALDIDAARTDMFNERTSCFVDGNVITNADGNVIHSIALVGLRRCYVTNNDFDNQIFFFWDTPDLKFESNLVKFYSPVPASSNNIIKHEVKALTKNYKYTVYYKDNIFNQTTPYSANLSMEYKCRQGNEVNVYGINNTYLGIFSQACFLVRYGDLNLYGDLATYDNDMRLTCGIRGEYSHAINGGSKPNEIYDSELRRYDSWRNWEVRGHTTGITDLKGNPVGTNYIGNTAGRPTLCIEGTQYFDTDLGKPIYAKGTKAKLGVTVTSGLTSPDSTPVCDDITVYMGSFAIKDHKQVVNGTDPIFEYLFRQHFDSGLIKMDTYWATQTKNIYCKYVGSVGDNYGVIHSNTVNGFTTTHTLINDGTIYWVYADGTAV